MAKLFVTYQQPVDVNAFNTHYYEKHVPLVKAIPGLRSYELSEGEVHVVAGKPGVFLIATLEFDSVAAIQAGLGSPLGQAAAGDLANFAGAGVELLMSETRML
ncbi:EthD family reductase [Glaciimonas immobilis]|uniref:Uncharacterized protein (TIGR02118 family) n=1 Tax=Glaciimonas immobilis TaxID=728004 RepID=A0A840RPA6_9BURK|nr:EthD family reductase [Glaciimonas immobilis]KAF3999126.1 EthD family reductase [Glaciimonas immobilis]MBB5198564.1 uncharacterized protein (TIGR02118 family) [Glaciimonas immobilis]